VILVWTGLNVAWAITTNDGMEAVLAPSFFWLLAFVPLVIYWYKTRSKSDSRSFSIRGLIAHEDGSNGVSGLARLASVILVVVGWPLTLIGLLLLGLGLYGVATTRTCSDCLATAPDPGQCFECGVGRAYAVFSTVIGLIGLVFGFVQVWAGSRAWRGDDFGRVLGSIVGTVGALLGWWLFQDANPHWRVAGREPWLAMLLVYGFVALVFIVRWKSRARTTLSD
jgi:uncharacterized membrane protein YeaQ/YmgE (transglycosylase-associated protein family)